MPIGMNSKGEIVGPPGWKPLAAPRNMGAKTKPPLGKIKLLHQASEEMGPCRYCGKPMSLWKPMEQCPKRQ